jgi:CheY-like chemotaxis protein
VNRDKALSETSADAPVMPAVPPFPEPLALAARSSIQDTAILVVTGRRTSREALQRILLAAAMRPTVVDPGHAIDELLSAELAGRPFPLVLIDARTPAVAGFEMAGRIRSIRQLSAVRIVLLPGYGRRGDAARCRELGVSAYLTRPLSRADVVAAIETVLETSPDMPSFPLVTRHLVGGHPNPLRVLLAEDDSLVRRLVSVILEKRGHSVVTAGNGRQALAALERESFDVLLTDVEMPELDGIATLQAVREREKSTARRLRVVAMTGHALEEDREHLLEAGMDGYVAKPIQPEDLFFVLECPAGGLGSPRSSRTLTPEPPVFDPRELLAAVDGDLRLLDLMVSVFREDWPRRVGELREAIRGRRGADLAGTAHALKGSIGTLRASNAFETARRLEFLGKQEDFAAAEETLPALEEKLHRLESRLSAFIEEGKR